jgi:transcription initiation factor TFIIA small subunit
MSNYELYRRSSLGIALTDTLDELIQEGHLDPQSAMKVLSQVSRRLTLKEHHLLTCTCLTWIQFDSSIAAALHTKVRSKCTMKGHLHIYRFCDDVWTFVVDNPSFRFENENVTADRIKVVACTAKSTTAAATGSAAAASASSS